MAQVPISPQRIVGRHTEGYRRNVWTFPLRSRKGRSYAVLQRALPDRGTGKVGGEGISVFVGTTRISYDRTKCTEFCLPRCFCCGPCASTCWERLLKRTRG